MTIKGHEKGVAARSERRGMILVVVLGIIVVLAVLAGAFAFRMSADLSSLQAQYNLQQGRWCVDSALDRIAQLLRDERTDTDAWYNNPEAFRRILVWAPDKTGGSQDLADQEKVEGRPAWRYSVVSYIVDGDETRIRYGLTDEASKINLRVAPRAQLLELFDQLELVNVRPEELADALIDWQDENETVISLNGAEDSYYMSREKAYRTKNRKLETIDELLMIRGFTGQVLYGEDYNRNGYLDEANEDDGEDGVFPPDNGDGILDRGILPYVTVYSWDWNFANDNKPRIPLMAVTAQFLENLEADEKASETFGYLLEEVSEEVLQFIADVNAKKYKWRSVGELYGLRLYDDGTSDYTDAWKAFDQELVAMNTARLELEEEEDTGEAEEEGIKPGDLNVDDPTGDLKDSLEGAEGIEFSEGTTDNSQPERPGANRGDRPAGGRGTVRDRGRENLAAAAAGEGEQKDKGEPLYNPVTPEDMVVLMDRFTAKENPAEPLIGLINVNTAPPSVLRTIPGLSDEQVAEIVAQRARLDGPGKKSLGWLAAYNVLDAETFALVTPMLTTRSIQFKADILGFADHTGSYKRFEVVIEMRGGVPQIKYLRDISSLGPGYPVHDDRRSKGFAFFDE